MLDDSASTADASQKGICRSSASLRPSPTRPERRPDRGFLWRLSELVPRHGSALLGDQVGEHEPTLAPRKAALVDRHAVGFHRDPAREENLQLQALAILLRTSCLDLGAPS